LIVDAARRVGSIPVFASRPSSCAADASHVFELEKQPTSRGALLSCNVICFNEGFVVAVPLYFLRLRIEFPNQNAENQAIRCAGSIS
jgi:hypothetical protein